MFRLVYASSAVKPFTERELEELLKKNRQKNGMAGITGMLLYKDGKFMQCLEGRKKVVCDLLAKIQADRRHRNMVILLREERVQREFEEWTMGFKKLDSKTALEVLGYSDFLDVSLTSEQFQMNPSKSLQLLLCFRTAKRYPRRD